MLMVMTVRVVMMSVVMRGDDEDADAMTVMVTLARM